MQDTDQRRASVFRRRYGDLLSELDRGTGGESDRAAAGGTGGGRGDLLP